MYKLHKYIYLIPLFIFSLFLFTKPIYASSDVEITIDPQQHTVVYPLEKSARIAITVTNNSNAQQHVTTQTSEDEPEGGHVLAPVGYYDLEPGESTEIIVVVEFSPDMDNKQDKIFNFSMELEWEGGSQTVEAEIKQTNITSKNTAVTTLEVTDSTTSETIPNYYSVITYQSGIETNTKTCSNKICKLETASGEYLEQMYEEYNIDQENPGLILQVSAPGYKSYFDTNFLAQDGSVKEISLEPLEKVGEYELVNTIDTGFSIWWIKASEDEQYFAFSQGTHGAEGIESPETTVVTMTDLDGSLLWQNEVEGECWGLDISPDANYVAAGCHSGNLYVWEKSGELYFQDDQAWSAVRWVKFSPDSQYLISGPVENTPELVGLYDLNTKETIYTLDIGSYLREARFSNDGKIIYLASANGQMFAMETETGEEIWAGSGGYYIPFILGISNTKSIIVTAGKGRSFRALDLLTGETSWNSSVDQTVTAGEVAEDGSVIGNTVGGLAYKLDSDGSISWSRMYGGVGHNAVFYTRNGQYALFGGPNSTLFDTNGNVLWQKDPDTEVQMSGPVEINTGAAYVTWVSSDGSLLILGGDDGNIDFYQGSVVDGENTYSQFTGIGERPRLATNKTENDNDEDRPSLLLIVTIIVGSVVLVGGIVLLVIIIIKRRKKDIRFTKP